MVLKYFKLNHNMTELDKEWEEFNADENNEKYNNLTSDNEGIQIPKCGQIYISTQTKIAFLDKVVDLNRVFWNIPIIDYHEPIHGGIIKKSMKISCKTDDEIKVLEDLIKTQDKISVDVITKYNKSLKKQKFKDVRKINVGISKKEIISIKKKIKKCFYNCFAIIMRLLDDDGVYKEIHIKIFNTGKLEIPGIQNDKTMYIALNQLIRVLNAADPNNNYNYNTTNIETVLINSNFNCGFYINRNKLFNILKYTYNIHAMYDPCSYPGIQCKYYYNDKNPHSDGVCYCENKCTKIKKHLNENNTKYCKEISFMIFRTGSVLIVGNCDERIINIIYSFLKKILVKEFKIIYNGKNDNIKKNKIVKKRKKNILIKNSITDTTT